MNGRIAGKGVQLTLALIELRYLGLLVEPIIKVSQVRADEFFLGRKALGAEKGCQDQDVSHGSRFGIYVVNFIAVLIIALYGIKLGKTVDTLFFISQLAFV